MWPALTSLLLPSASNSLLLPSGKRASLPAPTQLDPSCWDAFVDLLLYHMYHDQLPEGVSAAQVLEAARLADRFQVRCSCAGVCFGLAREERRTRCCMAVPGTLCHPSPAALQPILVPSRESLQRQETSRKTSSAHCT